MDEWLNKFVHLYHGILFSNKRNKLHTTTRIDLKEIMLSEKNQSPKVTY